MEITERKPEESIAETWKRFRVIAKGTSVNLKLQGVRALREKLIYKLPKGTDDNVLAMLHWTALAFVIDRCTEGEQKLLKSLEEIEPAFEEASSRLLERQHSG